jgi:iron complex outermembrane receptor protein
MGARDIIDVLLTVPGIDISMARFGQNIIGMRGIKTSNSEKVKVLIDGHSVNEPYFGGALILHDDLAIDDVKRIEVIRGPGSALYGANAFVGVIHIITYDASDINGFDVLVEGGSFDTKNGRMLFGKKIDELELSGFVKYYNTDGPYLEVREDAAGNPAEIRIPKEKIDLGLKAKWHGLQFNGRFTERQRGDYAGLTSQPNDETNMDLNQAFFEISYQRKFGKNFDLLWKVAYDRFEEDILFELIPDTEYNWFALTVRNFNSELQIDYDFGKNNIVTVGLVGEAIKQYDLAFYIADHPSRFSSPETSIKEEVKRNILAAYFQDIWQPTKSVNIVVGARFDHYTDVGNALSPRMGLTWNLLPNLYAKALYGQAFRAPSFIESYDSSQNSFGDENLNPEKIQTTEGSLGYYLTNHSLLTATLFRKEIKDLITVDTSGEQPFPYVNQGGATVNGVELELKGKFKKGKFKNWMSYYANYSYQDPQDDTGERLPDVPTHKGNIGLNIGFMKNLNLNLSTFISGERPRVRGDTRSEAGGYAISNLTLTVKNLPNTELGISFYNLFDRTYTYSSPINTLPYDFPLPGRHILVRMRTTF